MEGVEIRKRVLLPRDEGAIARERRYWWSSSTTGNWLNLFGRGDGYIGPSYNPTHRKRSKAPLTDDLGGIG